VTFSEADGLGHSRIHSLGEDPSGAVEVVSGDFRISRFDGRRFEQLRMRVAPNATCEWMSPCGRTDRSGGWWMLTTAGLAYWQPRARLVDFDRPPTTTFGSADGLASDTAFSAFADSRGRLWVGAALGGISVLDPARGQWRTFSEREGLPEPGTLTSRANAFAEDRDGRLWVGFEGGGLARERDGRFQRFGQADGVPTSSITALYVDASGGVWFATSQAGLGRIVDPSADRLQVRRVAVAEGLGSNNVRTLVEDANGRLYAGTSRGVDRITPETGEVTRYTVSEGLASQFVTASFRDRGGALWFGTMNGLSRLEPEVDDGSGNGLPAPPVFISGIRVSGVPQPLSELGDAAPPSFELPASNNRLEVEFFAVHYDTGAPIRYQYRLEGSDADWSAPAEQRSVNFAHLAPADYSFQVRAVRPDGTPGTQAATVTFSVLKPFYATWWFLGSAGLLAAGLAVVAYRIRVAQLLRVERVRARIATDLHDDIGASLSQIAILAEVVRTTGDARESDAVNRPLSRIAETSRALVDSMSDIVWAINPEKDALSDLVHRMRRFVEDTLGAEDADVTFSAPDQAQDLRLGADVKREVFLILKESVNNIAKHAQCRAVAITLTADRRQLSLEVADDGLGFDPAAGTDGNGVASMRRRVAGMGGRLDITSAPGRGTRIRLQLDLTRRRGRLLRT